MSLADARIRRFSVFTWLGGTAAAVVVAVMTMPFLAINPETGGLLFQDPNEHEYRPWTDPGAAEVVVEDGRIVGSADTGFLDLPSGDEVWVLGPLTGGQDDNTAVYQQLDRSVGVAEDRPEFLGLLTGTRELVVFPGATDGRLWFSPRLTDWTAPVQLETPTPIEAATVSGEGDALLSYRGDALSGRFVFDGDGFFTVDAITPGVITDLVEGVDEVDARASWGAGEVVVFRVNADDGPWTITLDEPASAP
ncbi:hypothetical protein [Microbacterium dauci]|uniref:Uncharacterized protein n=1 Tax=Microbacterium dauci TaxID=3048008 RepID=A0ABT6ZE79_9MICO|nr:hypothetical protein [Microbacterium sp. LX3-4]MDJ1114015.1 hypothetical protein [Microbacterium sp. LX3-4]